MLKIESLCKKYGKKSVLDNISFEVSEGEFVYLIGRNGIGKSTLIKIIAGLEEADGGAVSFTYPYQISVVSEDINFHPFFSVEKIVKTTSPFYQNWSQKIFRENSSECTFKLEDSFRSLSRGQKTQLQLCLALASQPKLILIDEATVTLDPIANIYFMNVLKDYTQRGGVVVFATNSLADISNCDYLLFLKDKAGIIKITDYRTFDFPSIEGSFS